MSERTFFLKLFAVIAVKLALLAGLWFFFVKDSFVHVDASRVNSRIHGDPS